MPITTVILPLYNTFEHYNYAELNYNSVYQIQTMLHNKVILDPLGNIITVPPDVYCGEGCRSYAEIKKVIADPAYVIAIGNEELYYFRFIAYNTNILLEARIKNISLVVARCIQNPDAEYISGLLKKGLLLPFNNFTQAM